LVVVAVTACRPGSALVDVDELPDLADDLAVRLEDPRLAEMRSWVAICDPERAWGGYTLVLHRQEVPLLIDLNGRIVHAWPEARVKSRVRLLTDGSLIGIGLDASVRRYDWEGNLVMEFRPAGEDAHHDLIELANGNLLALTRIHYKGWDDLLEIDPSGTLAWEWRSRGHLRRYARGRRGDLTHTNSVHELPDNPMWRAGDERFRPGNILMSVRQMWRLVIIDRQSGVPVWEYDRELDFAHEAVMVPPEHPLAGRILFFDNALSGRLRYRRSQIREIDPLGGETTWEYQQEGFWSPTAGTVEPLSNGNVLINSTRGHRIFEVTRGGRTVWQWTPPYDTTRSHRYAYDHAPQLAALPRPRPRAVEAGDGYRYLDPPVSAFVVHGEQRKVDVDAGRVSILNENNQCRRLLLPAAPRISFSYGLNRAALAEHDRRSYDAEFRLELRDVESGERRELMRDEVSIGPEMWREARVEVEGLDYRWIELCIETTSEGRPARAGWAHWTNPSIRPGATAQEEPPAAEGDLTPDELEARRRHLEALGYVD